jgi:hypothetical protein
LVRRGVSATSAPLSRADDSLATLGRVLLLERIRLLLEASSTNSLRLVLFGVRRAAAHLSVPSILLERRELAALEYLALMAPYWQADDVAHDSIVAMARGEDEARGATIMAGALVNDAFELALDRVALVWALCETILYAAGSHELPRHVLEAALMTCAASHDVIRAGYRGSLCALAAAVRAVPNAAATSVSATAMRASARPAAEHTARYAIECISFDDWKRSTHISR